MPFLKPSFFLLGGVGAYLLIGILVHWNSRKGSRSFAQLFYHPFVLPVSESQVQKNVNFFRFVMGLLIVHRFLDVFGVAVVAQPDSVRLAMASAAFLGGLIAVGLMTPIAIVLFGFLFMVLPPFFGTLGDQVAIIVLWLLFLLGAGRNYSVDALLMRWEPFRKPIRILYGFSVGFTPETFARVRFLGIFLFWSINFSAMAFHLFDDFWWKGDVLQIALATGFWNDHYALANSFKENYPALYDFLCVFGLYIQAFFETFMIPLMYCGWPGRMFVFFQGMGFFTMSLLFFNLGYLPLHEMVMWGILFGYGPAILPFRRTKEETQDRSHNLRFSSHPLDGLVVFAVIVCAVFNTLNLARIHGHPWNGSWPWTHPLWRPLHRTFAQEPVNVFNRGDLKTGAYRMVLYEVDESGTPLRVVPVMDLNGGRLDYVRNDYLYYGRLLRWLRSPEEAKFVDGDYQQFGDVSRQLTSCMIELDATLTGPKAGRIYRVEIGKREMVKGPRFLEWGEWTTLAEKEFRITPILSRKLKKEEPYTFSLGPGHWNSKNRATRTLEILKRHAFPNQTD